MPVNCPGAVNVRTPTIKLKKCPQCGEKVEMFSNELQTNCPKCNYTIYDDLASCVQWCKYAIDCVGEEAYNRLKKGAAEKPAESSEKTA